MKVKDFKKLFEGQDDEKDVVILSCSGMEWKLNNKVKDNPKETDKQVVIYIK